MQASAKQTLDTAISGLPESLREAAQSWHSRLEAGYPDAIADFPATGGDIAALIRVIACSEFAGDIAISYWPWLCLSCKTGQIGHVHCKQTVQRRFDLLVSEANETDGFKRDLRILRTQTLFEILWRDLVSECALTETLAALSDLADCAINAASDFAGTLHRERYGVIPHNRGVMPLVILAMGKLGGRELNFSSDIDIVFLYPGDGESDGDSRLSAHEYFARYARQVVSLLGEVTSDGFVYRVDTRLRPFGKSGPPVVSFSALEAYLLQHGRDWERYAYVKARVASPTVACEPMRYLMDKVIEPFVYRRYLDYGVFESLREMHALVAVEVRKQEMEDNIKLGPGGIREIEFIVQSMQLVRGGSEPGLRSAALREALQSAITSQEVDRKRADELLQSYEFLRRVENYIQAFRDQQLHHVPKSDVARDRLAFMMRFSSWDELASNLEACRSRVSEHFSAFAFRDSSDDADDSDVRTALAALWAGRAEDEDWERALIDLGMDEAVAMAKAVTSFRAVVAKQKVDTIVAERLRKFVPALLLSLASRRKPARTIKRVLKIVDKVLRRSAYIALLNENRRVLPRLVGLCEKSSYLADEIGRFPILLDELLDPRIYNRTPTAEDIAADLEASLGVATTGDSEQRVEIVGRFQRATLFRLAVADTGGSIPIMKVSDRLTDLAEIVLRRTLQIAYDDLVARYGEPEYELQGRQRTAGLGIIAYGKLGGMELSYGSDLDLVFLHDSEGELQQTNGATSIENSVFFARLVRHLVHFLTTQTGSGVLYEIDTRLRPSGRSGLLVTNIEAFERYQEENAWTWEHQALLRSRPVAGRPGIARQFERIRTKTLCDRVHRESLASDVQSMQKKMRDNLDKSTADQFDLKQGYGGIGDIEFLVQYLALNNAVAHPAVIYYRDNIRQMGTLVAAGCLPENEGKVLQEIYRTYRTLLHRLALDDRPSLSPEAEFQEERAFVQDLWERTFDNSR